MSLIESHIIEMFDFSNLNVETCTLDGLQTCTHLSDFPSKHALQKLSFAPVDKIWAFPGQM